jgi:hypothetical protein
MAEMTRGQFIYRLVTEMGLPVSKEVVGAGFADTDGTYLDAVVTAALNAGIITAGTNFRTTDVITREQAATMLGRAFNITGDAGGSSFADVDATSYYAPYVSGMQSAGIFTGLSNTQFGTGQGFDSRYFDDVFEGAEAYSAEPAAPPPDVGPTSPVVTPTELGGTEYGGSNDDVDEVAAADPDAVKDLIDFLRDEYQITGLDQWVEDMMVGTATTRDDVLLELRKTEPWQTRFKAIVDRQQAGLPPISVQNVLDYEKTARSLMKAAGLPPGFYDSPEDFVALQVGDISPLQLSERIEMGFERVAMAPPEIRAAYEDMFGVAHGDEYLAAYFLDPEKAQIALEREVNAAEVRGTADKFGIGLADSKAMELAGRGISRELAWTGFSRLSALEPVFQESFGETDDLSAEEEGIAAQFENDAASARAIDRRTNRRTAEFSGGGGAATTQAGVIGLGSA